MITTKLNFKFVQPPFELYENRYQDLPLHRQFIFGKYAYKYQLKLENSHLQVGFNGKHFTFSNYKKGVQILLGRLEASIAQAR